MVERSEHGIQRRVGGDHDFRFDGITDLTLRCRGASVLDVGCNRGMAALDLAKNGATLVHGCDIDEDCIHVARAVFADIRNVSHKFEVVDLTKDLNGQEGFRSIFPPMSYDIVLLFAVYHKLSRLMEQSDLDALMTYFAKHCDRYIGWRGPLQSDATAEIKHLDELFKQSSFERIQTSYISESIGPAAIWRRES